MKQQPQNTAFSARVCHFLVPILCLICASVPFGVLHAQQDDSLDLLFTIRGIHVDVTANKASAARDEALQEAETKAYDTLLKKITQPEGRAKLPDLTIAEKQALVSGIEVREEQSSSRRYIATLDVRFEPTVFSSFLAKYNVPHVVGTGNGVLVMHSHKSGLEEYLWEPNDAMKAARGTVDWHNRIRNYVFSKGLIKERLMVTYGEVSKGFLDSALTLALDYGVQSALLIDSEWKPVAGGGGTLIYTYNSSESMQQHEAMQTIQSEIGEEDAIARMYDSVLDSNDTLWRKQLLVDTNNQGIMETYVTTSDLQAIAKIEKCLSQVTLITDVRVLSISVPLSKFSFSYTGNDDQLALALQYAGLVLDDYGTQKMLSLKKTQGIK
ncbi:DUF2066 domain-containing protein [Kordiimonas pumila]|uniref:DUF2066 domain-containing protein n=1 Tax=Kordiimonas pumila TaxID=2161677 RepID=A0ABV7D237_9PROT|nr:DUF2066 domain-containing protein [Kordiimonas pumila]